MNRASLLLPSLHVFCKSVVVPVILAIAPLLADEQARSIEDVSKNPAPPVDNPALPTLFVIGDSTASNRANGGLGWGNVLAPFFDAKKINVANRARGGRSSRTFLEEGLWDKALGEMKAGDFVLIQFGHNDAGPLFDQKARGSLPGIGEETQEGASPGKPPQRVHTFGWYLRRYVADARAKRANPILLSPTVRNIWKEGHVEWGPGHYGAWTAQIATELGVPFVDASAIIADRYELLGQEKVRDLFATDHTHTNAAGAAFNAEAVVSGLKGHKKLAFAAFLSERGSAVEADRVGWLNLPRPANPRLPTLFLIGDSTVRNGRGDGAGGQWGWGDRIGALVDATKINVVNRAVGGLSSRTFLTQGYWERVLAWMKPGDFLILQFGHNDAAPLNDKARARGTLRGVGDESEDIDNLLTGRRETVHSYGWYLRRYIAETRAKGATVFVCSPVPRKTWRDGRIARSTDGYPQWAEAVAHEAGAPYLDLHERIALRYEALGIDKVDTLFADEHTHTSDAGAALNAAVVVEALEALQSNPLAPYLVKRPNGDH